MEKKDLLALATKFLSRRILALAVVLYAALQGVDLPRLICLAAVAAVYIVCVTFGPNKENGGVKKLATAGMLLFALLLASATIAAPSADAEILPFIDKLDIQIGPGLAVSSLKPFVVETVLLGTAKIYQRWGFEARIGGLVDDDREALVLGISRELKDLITREDDDEDKVLLPSLGLWMGADLVSSLNEETGETEHKISFLWGVNAVLAEF